MAPTSLDGKMVAKAQHGTMPPFSQSPDSRNRSLLGAVENINGAENMYSPSFYAKLACTRGSPKGDEKVIRHISTKFAPPNQKQPPSVAPLAAAPVCFGSLAEKARRHVGDSAPRTRHGEDTPAQAANRSPAPHAMPLKKQSAPSAHLLNLSHSEVTGAPPRMQSAPSVSVITLAALAHMESSTEDDLRKVSLSLTPRSSRPISRMVSLSTLSQTPRSPPPLSPRIPYTPNYTPSRSASCRDLIVSPSSVVSPPSPQLANGGHAAVAPARMQSAPYSPGATVFSPSTPGGLGRTRGTLQFPTSHGQLVSKGLTPARSLQSPPLSARQTMHAAEARRLNTADPIDEAVAHCIASVGADVASRVTLARISHGVYCVNGRRISVIQKNDSVFALEYADDRSVNSETPLLTYFMQVAHVDKSLGGEDVSTVLRLPHDCRLTFRETRKLSINDHLKEGERYESMLLACAQADLREQAARAHEAVTGCGRRLSGTSPLSPIVTPSLQSGSRRVTLPCNGEKVVLALQSPSAAVDPGWAASLSSIVMDRSSLSLPSTPPPASPAETPPVPSFRL